jgi:hypothetical protein
LCNRCNLLIGLSGDCRDLMNLAAAYLSRHD